MRTTSFLSATLLLAGHALLAGCAVTIGTDPDRYSIEPKAVSQLRVPQEVALLNAYQIESITKLNLSSNTFSIDKRQLTQTAIAMLGRALQGRGYQLAPQAQKSIRLQVVPTGMMHQPFRYTGRIVLEARFGDGSVATIPQENLGATWERAFDGAVLFALNDLLEHERFLAYVNK